ncbi:MAG TPA: ABC transporter ATP-binding protein [Methylocystis sp.]|nr:ABC transporter ATP-binding protein [Methylocystis sp.]
MGAAVTGPGVAAIALENVTLGYDRRPAVHHLSGVIAAGELLAVCGPNGGGKSTLLNGLAGLIAPMGGRIGRGGAAARDFAYLPQAAQLDRAFPISVADFVALGALRRKGIFGRIDQAESDRVANAVAAVGLEGFETRVIGELSGGQLQRALFARLMVEDGGVILLDEPFGAIDAATTDDLLALVAAWRAEGRTVVAALHELDLVRRAFPKTLLLAREAIFWGDTEKALTPGNLAAARAMARAHQADAAFCQRDESEPADAL